MIIEISIQIGFNHSIINIVFEKGNMKNVSPKYRLSKYTFTEYITCNFIYTGTYSCEPETKNMLSYSYICQ